MASDFSSHHVIKQTPRSFPWGIVLICILFVSFLLWSKWDRVTQIFGTNTSLTNSLQNSGFVIGDPISLEGEIRADGDFITHTHTLLTQSSGVFGLKSKTINLSQYTGSIGIDGTVALQSSGLVIIEVTSVMDLNPQQLTGQAMISGDNLATTGDTASTTGVIATGNTVAPITTGTTQVAPITSSSTNTQLAVPKDVVQIPVTIGTGILFTSSRGHTILFPSKKISFQSVNLASTDFGIKGLRCYSQMNVVAYADKDQVLTAPAVKIYECTNKTTEFPSQFAAIPLDDGRVFLIEAVNPAWGDFANAIQIGMTATTN